MTTDVAGSAPLERHVRPECWAFAMDFLGEPENAEVGAYAVRLETENARLCVAIEHLASGLDAAEADRDAAVAALKNLDARLLECMALGLSVAEAYDSHYQAETAEALAVGAA